MILIYFTSKKDIIYSLVVWLTIVVLLFSIVLNLTFTIFNIFLGLIGLLVIGFLVWIWFGTGYQIEKEVIKVQNGPFRLEVTIKDIKSVGRTKSLLATPALSVDRLVLRYGQYDEILISPKKENEFIKLLLTKNPQIHLD